MARLVVKIVPSEIPAFARAEDLRAFCDLVLDAGTPGRRRTSPVERSLLRSVVGFLHWFPPYRRRQNLDEALALISELDEPVAPGTTHFDWLVSEFSVWLGNDGVPAAAGQVLTDWSDYRAATCGDADGAERAKRNVAWKVRRLGRIWGIDDCDGGFGFATEA